MRDNKEGFTIIEVVLVLAIAGLIFLVVFLALPNLQAARRDTQRKSNMFRVIALMENFESNIGRLPITDGDVARFNSQYLETSNMTDPTTNSYSYTGITIDTANGHRIYPTDLGQILYKARHKCAQGAYVFEETDIITHVDELPTTAAVWTKSEIGGYICVDNGGER